jgi:hypothetical protein
MLMQALIKQFVLAILQYFKLVDVQVHHNGISLLKKGQLLLVKEE